MNSINLKRITSLALCWSVIFVTIAVAQDTSPQEKPDIATEADLQSQGNMVDVEDPALSLSALYARIDSIRRSNSVSSTQVAVLLPDTTVFWNFGQNASGAPVTDSTMFRVGSVSKTFAGLSMLMLVDRELVSLDTSLVELAPELPIRNPWRVTHPVRLSHLLEAGAGFVGFHPSDYESPDVGEPKLKRVITELPYRLDVQWQPGDYTAYHNIGPSITAYLIEKITGERYEDYVQENIFGPLGMNRSSFFLTPTVARLLADTSAYEHISFRPAGALNTSVHELAALVRMLLNRGTYEGRRLLSSDMVKRFETPTSTLAARKLGIHLGHAVNNWTTSYKGIRYHAHSGSIPPGYSAYYAYSPKHKTGFAYASTMGASGKAIHYPLIEAVLAHLHPTEPSPIEAASAADHPDLLGCYVLANPPSLEYSLERVRVKAEDGKLTLVDLDTEGSPDGLWTMEEATHPRLFRVRSDRHLHRDHLRRQHLHLDGAVVAFMTNDDGTLIMQNLEFSHEAFARMPCR